MIEIGLREVRKVKEGIIMTVEVEMSEVVATTVATDLVKSSRDNLVEGIRKVWTR